MIPKCVIFQRGFYNGQQAGVDVDGFFPTSTYISDSSVRLFRNVVTFKFVDSRVDRPLVESCQFTYNFSLGVLYENGEGVAQDYVKAIAPYQKAGDIGYDAVKRLKAKI